jgi:hypothetical protein
MSDAGVLNAVLFLPLLGIAAVLVAPAGNPASFAAWRWSR